MYISSLYNSLLANSNKLANQALIDNSAPIGSQNIQQEPNNQASIDKSFSDILNEKIDTLNAKQVEADNLTQRFMAGQVEDLHQVLIATEEARLTLELAVQIRNKTVEAFKEINSMQF